MQNTELSWFLDIITNYISFGLALYAVGAIVSLVWMRRKKQIMPSAVMKDLSRTYFCVVCLVLLEATRQVWDTFNDYHFPLWITRILLPVLYLTLGNSIISVTNAEAGSAVQTRDERTA